MTPFRLIFFVIAICSASLDSYAGGKPDEATLAADLKRITTLKEVFFATQAKGEQFGDEYWRASKRLAEERGPIIIHAVLEDSKSWKGEEGLIYLPLVALLPREEAVKLLKQYQNGSDQQLKLWAGEFLIEFDASDVKEAVGKYQAEQ